MKKLPFIEGHLIKRIEITPIHVPFREPIRNAMSYSAGGLGMAIKAEEQWLGEDFVICKLITDTNYTGLGEAFVWLPETGVSPNQICDAIQNYLGKYLLNANPFDIEKINQRMENNVARTEVAKGLLDMACYDLMGQILHKPVYELIGEKKKDPLPLTALVPLMDPSTMSGIAKMFYKEGYRSFRYKLGQGIKEDIAIVERFRKKLGEEVRLRVDYNQAYSPQDAIKAINAIEPYHIDVAEQPVRATDYIGLAEVQKHVKIPIMTHEGSFSLNDIYTLTELGAIKVVGINSERPGGVSQALKAIDFAQSRKMGIVLHNQPLGIASAMQIHLATAYYDILGYEIELFGHYMLEDDLILNTLEYVNGTVKVPEGPGWGIQLDEMALQKYKTNPTIIIEDLIK